MLSLSVVACQNQSSSGGVTLTLSILGEEETSNFYFEDATLLDVLKLKYEVETKKTFYTEYIKCVKNVCVNDEYSWVYYVNDKPINYGVNVYQVQDQDKVLFAYKKV